MMPAFDDESGPASKRSPDDLRRIARYQRWLIAVVLAQLALWGGFFVLVVLSGGRMAGGMHFPMILTFILGGLGGIYVFMLGCELRNGCVALMLGFATVVPVLGLFVLTLVNGYATSELRKHGVRVGTFGAHIDDIENRRTLYDDEDAGW